mmetsp:Transcript_22255/g.25590  ORF Transcript_22255/g.25590 Transcript_22255/m.25590 type:complete len:122 (+) Transcript_22255:126-491(+)
MVFLSSRCSRLLFYVIVIVHHILLPEFRRYNFSDNFYRENKGRHHRSLSLSRHHHGCPRGLLLGKKGPVNYDAVVSTTKIDTGSFFPVYNNHSNSLLFELCTDLFGILCLMVWALSSHGYN